MSDAVKPWLALILVVFMGVEPTQSAGPEAGLKRIGILYQDSLFISRIDAFRDKLRELGYEEGRTVKYEYRIAGKEDPHLAAAALVQSGVDIIVTPGTQAALAAKDATSKIPIVFYVADPVGSGLVASLARPGGNVTGIASLGDETGAKRLELLKEVVPNATRVAVLVNPDNLSSVAQQRVVKASARRLGLKLIIASARRNEDIESALAVVNRKQVDAFLILPDVVLMGHNARIAEHALRARVPGVFAYRMFPEAGGLMSYGPNFGAVWQRCAVYADRILNGANPAELPVEQPTKFELVVNLKTAKALGLAIPNRFYYAPMKSSNESESYAQCHCHAADVPRSVVLRCEQLAGAPPIRPGGPAPCAPGI